ncbi:Alpha-actinin-like protein, partial [Lachnellula occidentalis]
ATPPPTPFPPSPSPPASIKSRRDRTSSQREANRSKQFTTRLNRSASAGDTTDPLTGRRRKGFQQHTSSLPADHGLKAVEPPHEQALTKMAFAEQQKWITVQQKTFTKWLNTKVAPRKVAVLDLVVDLSDGVILIHLLECLSAESLGRYAAKPKLRVQKFENANLSLDFIKSRGIQMTNIGAEDVVDGNRKIILGLIWTLILRFTISDINLEGMTAKEGLLLWCQRKTACYDEVNVRNFTDSWNDGLAFCALLDIHRPDLIDYDTLDKSDHKGNMQLAFDIASKEIGIPDLLDVEDVAHVAKPDERSLMTYIAYWFHAFSQMEKVENAGRRVEKFVNSMQGAWEMQSNYERRMRALLQHVEGQGATWQESKFEGTYVDAKQQAADFSAYKRGKKREWVAEKSDLAALLGNIKTKMSTYRLRAYEPPPELSLQTMDQEWAKMIKLEMARGQLINENIRDIKNALRKSFADKANDFALALNTMQLAISGLEGDVEDQLVHIKMLNEKLPPLHQYLETIAVVDQKCEEANIEENDFTTYTYDELCYEMSLVKGSVSKKLAFLDNQVVARNMTNLTPIQLEEFESVFRHFDRDASNSLQELEFSAALASLGLVFSEDEMHDYFLETSNGRNSVTFEQFIRFMVDVTEDQNTAEQVFQSFREVADGKPYVTEMDLRHSLVPDEIIDKLTEIVPPHKGPDLQQDRGMPQYDYISFMDKLLRGPEEGALTELPNGRTRSGSVSPTKTNGYH